MLKKQFFESLRSEATDGKWDVINSFGRIKAFFDSFLGDLDNQSAASRLIPLFHEVLLRARMFDGIFNGDWERRKTERADGREPLWPLVVIYLYGEPLFVNRSYCRASGLSPDEVRTHALANDLYEQVYERDDAQRAREQVQKLKAGRWYHDFWLSMKHSNRLVLWNSYGGAGERIEIRIGRDITNLEDVRDEGADHYSGNAMYSAGILEEIYAILSGYESIGSEIGYPLTWIAEYLSMFDFLWNHGWFLMECLFASETGRISGTYNNEYARLFEKSFREDGDFGKSSATAHGQEQEEFMREISASWAFSREETFHKRNKKPVAQVFWRYFSFREDFFTEHPVFGIGMPVAFKKEDGLLKKIFGRLLSKK